MNARIYSHITSYVCSIVSRLLTIHQSTPNSNKPEAIPHPRLLQELHQDQGFQSHPATLENTWKEPPSAIAQETIQKSGAVLGLQTFRNIYIYVYIYI